MYAYALDMSVPRAAPELIGECKPISARLGAACVESMCTACLNEPRRVQVGFCVRKFVLFLAVSSAGPKWFFSYPWAKMSLSYLLDLPTSWLKSEKPYTRSFINLQVW